MIVVAGEALVDLVLGADGSVAATVGGGPYNTARTVGRLGGRVAFLGGVSGDRFGRQIHRRLLDDHVDDSLVQLTDLPTTLAAAELDASGTATYRFYIAGTSAPNVHPIELPADVTALHVGTLGLVIEPLAKAVDVIVAGVADRVIVMVDLNCRSAAIIDSDAYVARVERVARRADVVKVSTDDLRWLADVLHRDPVEWLVGFGGVVLHTDGGHAVRVVRRDTTVSIEVPRVSVVDTIGAGDAFGGAFIAWWDEAGLGRDDLSDVGAVRAAVAVAVQVASITCTRRGADPPLRAELGEVWPR